MAGLLDLPGNGLLARKQRLRNMTGGYEGVPRTRGLLDPAHAQMKAAEAHMAANPQPDMPLLHNLAMATSPVPVVGDVLGVANDAAWMIADPEKRTWLDFLGAGLGALPFVPSAAIMLGASAKTAKKAALEMAQQLEKSGATREEIWQATGETFGQPWMKAQDGKWRFEADDSAMQLDKPAIQAAIEARATDLTERLELYNDAAVLRREVNHGNMTRENMREEFIRRFGRAPARGSLGMARQSTLEDLRESVQRTANEMDEFGAFGNVAQFVDHNDLVAGYPTIGEYPMKITQGPYTGASFTEFRTDQPFGQVTIRGGTPVEQRSSALHELQHAVQQIEGFARGGSPDAFAIAPSQVSAAKHLRDDAFLGAVIVRQLRRSGIDRIPNIWENSEAESIVRRVAESQGRTYDEAIGGLFAHTDDAGLIATADQATKKALDLEDRYNNLLVESVSGINAHNQYLRLAGEAEARAVEARRDLTSAQRISRPFWEYYDVPEEDQLIKGNRP